MVYDVGMEINELDIMVICKHIINGGSVLDLCEMWGIGYDMMWEWVQADKDRAVLYERAVCGQNEWAIIRVLKELKAMAMADIRELYDESGKLKHPKEWPEHVARAVKSVDVFEEYEGSGKGRTFVGYTKKVQTWDKLKALEMIGKYLKMFVDRVDVSGALTLEDLVDSSRDARVGGRLPMMEN